MVEETFEAGMTVSLVARPRGVGPNQSHGVASWRKATQLRPALARRWCRRRIIGHCRTKFVSFIG